MTETVTGLIEESIREDRIVHVRRANLSDADMADLFDHCEDTTPARGDSERDDMREFWGADQDGDPWRVHVEGI